MCNTRPCYIIPPYVLEGLARRGSLPCKRALNDARRILEKRKTALNGLLLRGPVSAHGDRTVYDSGHTYKQRVTQVRQEDGIPSQDQVANQAFEGSGFVRDYYKASFGLDSIDNMGMPVISNIHYGVKYNNAFWDGDEMTYGDGDGVEFINFTNAIDVVAHELTHGVTQFIANLEYYGQSGALNEHFSDVFGTIIKQKYLGQTPGEADWLIGDSIVTDRFPGKAIRSMKAPGTANEFDIQPDHMDRYNTDAADNQGVHINSGIPNKAFYLAATALGMEDASQIWFEVLGQLWRTADFSDMLRECLDVAKRLSGEGRVQAGAESAISDSFSAVGLTIETV